VLYPGTLGMKFTTIEGLLNDAYDQIKTRHNFALDPQEDDDDPGSLTPFKTFLIKLRLVSFYSTYLFFFFIQF